MWSSYRRSARIFLAPDHGSTHAREISIVGLYIPAGSIPDNRLFTVTSPSRFIFLEEMSLQAILGLLTVLFFTAVGMYADVHMCTTMIWDGTSKSSFIYSRAVQRWRFTSSRRLIPMGRSSGDILLRIVGYHH